MKCDRCGQSYEMALPAPLSIAIAIVRAFGELHHQCEPKGKPE